MINSNIAVFCETEKEFEEFVKNTNLGNCVRVRDMSTLVGYNFSGFVTLNEFKISDEIYTALSRRLQSRICGI